MTDIENLTGWLNSVSSFSRTPDQKMFLDILTKTDEEALQTTLDKFGGVAAIEIQCFGAPIAELHKRGYAPGGYMGFCGPCGKQFIGDKRASTCVTCAVNSYAKNCTATCPR